MPGSLVRVPTVRADGVKTHVWRKMDSSPIRASTLPPPSTAARPATKGTSAVTPALAFDPRAPRNHPLPSWWKKNARRDKDTLPKNIKDYPDDNTPQLIDVFDSPIGKITVTWLPAASDLIDRGYRVSRLAFHDEKGEQIGYIKASCVPDHLREWAFGDDEFSVFRAHNEFRNSVKTDLSFQGFEGREETGKNPPRPADIESVYRELWVDAMKHDKAGIEQPDGSYVPYYSIEAEDSAHLSFDEVKTRVGQFEKKLRANFYDDWLERNSPLAPFVDYSSIEYEYQGIGLGTALYIYAAKQLSLDGAVLRASGTQSEYAQSVWRRLSRDMPERVITIGLNWMGEKENVPALDFR